MINSCMLCLWILFHASGLLVGTLSPCDNVPTTLSPGYYWANIPAPRNGRRRRVSPFRWLELYYNLCQAQPTFPKEGGRRKHMELFWDIHCGKNPCADALLLVQVLCMHSVSFESRN